MMQRVLSIQSHVVSGYVGNRSAVFPLQVLGFEVDFINSVQFSNHTGYKTVKGQTLEADQLGDLMQGLHLNNINRYSHLLTGYIGSTSFLMKIVDVVKELKQVNSDLIYVCDPVMGDNGQMYVPQDLLPLYQEYVVPLADVIVPNQYEAELLTGRKITNEEDAVGAMEDLHKKGIKTVVLSSSNLTSDEKLVALASTMLGDGTKRSYKITYPRFPVNFTGSGDLFAALLLAWLSTSDMETALEKTIATMQAVLEKTMLASYELAGKGEEPTSEHLELKLIQSINDIQNPKVRIRATTS